MNEPTWAFVVRDKKDGQAIRRGQNMLWIGHGEDKTIAKKNAIADAAKYSNINPKRLYANYGIAENEAAENIDKAS